MTDDRETDRRSHDQMLARKLDNVIELLEGKPILSPITDEVTGHELGLIAKVDELYAGINGGAALRWKREWTPVQRWVIGLFAALFTGILMVLSATL